MTRVLIIDGSIHPGIYRPTAGWRQWLGEVPSDSVHLPTGEALPELDGYTHLIVTGSEASIVNDDPWFDVEARVVRSAVDRGLRVMGSCFGHQMLARALCGRAYVARAATPEMGWLRVQVTASDALLGEAGQDIWMFASHFDEVRDPPAPWKVLARTEGCAVHAMRLSDRPVWGIQAHPEITPREGRTLLEGFLPLYPGNAALIAAALAGEVRDDGAITSIVKAFLKD